MPPQLYHNHLGGGGGKAGGAAKWGTPDLFVHIKVATIIWLMQ